MKFLLLVIALFTLIHTSSAKEVAVGDAFSISLPDTAREQARSQDSPDTILAKYHDETFQLFMYRWPDVKASVPLKGIPEQWAKNKKWASVSSINEGRTDSDIPYVTFKTRIVEGDQRPFDSFMTVLRSATGSAYMLQMVGDTKAIDAIRKSIKNK